MGRYLRVKTTGQVTDYQDDATPGIQIKNFLSTPIPGVAQADIEEVVGSKDEFYQALEMWENNAANPYYDKIKTERIKLQLASSDAQMGRGTEDLIDVLVAKGVITLTDLPAGTQAKLAKHKDLRAQLGG